MNLRKADEEVALVGGSVERHAIVITQTCIEEVLHVVLNRKIRLQVL